MLPVRDVTHIPSPIPYFLSSFFFAFKYAGRSFLNHPNFYKYSQKNFHHETLQNRIHEFSALHDIVKILHKC